VRISEASDISDVLFSQKATQPCGKWKSHGLTVPFSTHNGNQNHHTGDVMENTGLSSIRMPASSMYDTLSQLI
jgi:hypothetical protein